MLYFIFSENDELVKEKINSFIGQEDVINHDCAEFPFTSVYNDLMSLDLFGDKKRAIVKNLDVVQGKSKKDQLLINQLIDINKNDNALLFIILNKKLSTTNINIASIAGSYEYLELNNNPDDIMKNIMDMNLEEKINISKNNILLLLKQHDNNLNIVKEEIKKLYLVNPGQEITEDIILQYGIPNNNYNIWKLTEYLLLGNSSGALKIIDLMQQQGSNILEIFGLYLTQLRFYYQVKILNQNNSKKDIATILRKNEYRVGMTIQLTNKVSLIKIKSQYIKLAELDYKIKQGLIDENVAISIFINN